MKAQSRFGWQILFYMAIASSISYAMNGGHQANNYEAFGPPPYPALPVSNQRDVKTEESVLFDFFCQDPKANAPKPFNSNEFYTNLRLVKKAGRLDHLKNLFPTLPAAITHEDLFKILSAFKKRDQPLAYKWLISKVNTKMSSYPFERFKEYKEKVDIKIFAAEVVKTAGTENSDSVQQARKILKGRKVLNSIQLERVLMLIAPISTKATEKELVELRDHLREYMKYDEKAPGVNEWTASDLFVMKVPLNIDVLVNALKMTDKIDEDNIDNISELIELVMASARKTASNIIINPRKPKMKPPKVRGVDWQVIENLIHFHVKRLIPDTPAK